MQSLCLTRTRLSSVASSPDGRLLAPILHSCQCPCQLVATLADLYGAGCVGAVLADMRKLEAEWRGAGTRGRRGCAWAPAVPLCSCPACGCGAHTAGRSHGHAHSAYLCRNVRLLTRAWRATGQVGTLRLVCLHLGILSLLVALATGWLTMECTTTRNASASSDAHA